MLVKQKLIILFSFLYQQVLNSDNAIEANSTLIKSFVEAYKDDEEMKTVDVVFCGHPVSLCELYMQLNKSVLVLASTRYDNDIVAICYDLSASIVPTDIFKI